MTAAMTVTYGDDQDDDDDDIDDDNSETDDYNNDVNDKDNDLRKIGYLMRQQRCFHA